MRFATLMACAALALAPALAAAEEADKTVEKQPSSAPPKSESAPAPTNVQHADLKCEMSFTLSGWSIFYKIYKGTGSVTCTNGQSMKVALKSEGGGLTAGKSSIDNGHGEFVGVRDIRDVLGDYASGGAHAGAGKSSIASGLTKGEVSLSLTGTGRGVDLGVDFGKFTIAEAGTKFD